MISVEETQAHTTHHHQPQRGDRQRAGSTEVPAPASPAGPSGDVNLKK